MSTPPGPIGILLSPLIPDAAPNGSVMTGAAAEFDGWASKLAPLEARAVSARDAAVQPAGWVSVLGNDVNSLFARYAPYQYLADEGVIGSASGATGPDDVLRAQAPAHPGELTATDPMTAEYNSAYASLVNFLNSLQATINSWIIYIPPE